MRVVIADDHALLRQGVASFLQTSFPSWEFSQAAEPGEALAAVADADADLLIIDPQMHGMHGSESLKQFRDMRPDLKVAVLTDDEDRSAILECFAAGVNGYILKFDATQELLTALKTIADGGVYAPSALSRSPGAVSRTASRPKTDAVMPALTARQQDVMTLLSEGLSTKMIARRLSLGVGTVKVHLAALYRALDVHTRMEAVMKAGAMMESK